MKLQLPKLSKTQKIVAGFAIATAIAFLVWGCGASTTNEVKADSTEMKVDTLKVDTLK